MTEYLEYEIDECILLVKGFNSILNDINDPNSAGVKGMMLACGIEGNFWDTVKDTAKKIAEKIMDVIRSIRDFFINGDGNVQVEKEYENAKETVQSIAKLDQSIPIDKKSDLTNPSKYFKDFDLPELSEDISGKLSGFYNTLKSSVEKLSSASTIKNLHDCYTDIIEKSKSCAEGVTELIKTATSDTEKAANELTKIDVPSSDETQEVKDAKKEEQKTKTEEANKGLDSSKALAKIRNKFLVPCTVISKSYKQVAALKDASNFKG